MVMVMVGRRREHGVESKSIGIGRTESDTQIGEGRVGEFFPKESCPTSLQNSN